MSIDNNYWNVLVADDDPDVFIITQLVIEGQTFLGKTIRVFQALNEAETIKELSSNREYCVLLLDVVMDTEHSGLDIIQQVRNVLHNDQLRIILRTGQPGSAPERKVITNYDINDYKEKTELSSTKLYTSVIASIRSYNDIKIIEQGQRGLEMIIKASQDILHHHSVQTLAEGILTQISLLVDHDNSAIIATSDGLYASNRETASNFKILYGSGTYANHVGEHLYEILPENHINLVEQTIETHTSHYLDNIYVGFLKDEPETLDLILFKSPNVINELDQDILELFQSNFELAFKNIRLHEEITTIQSDIIFKLGDIVETRSGEVGNHVRRVAEQTYILSKLYGLDNEECELYKLASTMHDVGKVGIPDNILLKPGALSDTEFNFIKTHTTIGNHILQGSGKRIFDTAAEIALYHHEQWDSFGYPNKLSKDNIPLNARIVSITDVFDALSHKRCYKEAWDKKQIIDLFTQNIGKKFDPVLCQLFLDNIQLFYDINDQYTDNS